MNTLFTGDQFYPNTPYVLFGYLSKLPEGTLMRIGGIEGKLTRITRDPAGVEISISRQGSGSKAYKRVFLYNEIMELGFQVLNNIDGIRRTYNTLLNLNLQLGGLKISIRKNDSSYIMKIGDQNFEWKTFNSLTELSKFLRNHEYYGEHLGKLSAVFGSEQKVFDMISKSPGNFLDFCVVVEPWVVNVCNDLGADVVYNLFMFDPSFLNSEIFRYSKIGFSGRTGLQLALTKIPNGASGMLAMLMNSKDDLMHLLHTSSILANISAGDAGSAVDKTLYKDRIFHHGWDTRFLGRPTKIINLNNGAYFLPGTANHYSNATQGSGFLINKDGKCFVKRQKFVQEHYIPQYNQQCMSESDDVGQHLDQNYEFFEVGLNGELTPIACETFYNTAK